MWVRLKQVALVATDLDLVVDQLAAVFDVRVAFRDPMVGQWGLRNAVLPVGSQLLEVIVPVRTGTAAGRHLERRAGPGGYMVITHSNDQDAVRKRLPGLGVRTAFQFEHDGWRCLQLHPADTGGAFLEIDQQDGAENPEGPWAPAGPDWQKKVSTDVVDAITAVRVQCAEPARVAARWSAITGIALSGSATLDLDSGTVEFVPTEDDRGDGLAAVVVHTRDAPRALAAAEQRGLRTGDAEITLCGVRFVLATP